MIERKTFTTPPRRVALFVTCMVDMLYPEVGMATAEILERLGLTVVFPYEQTCCGQPAFNAGYRHEARTLGRRFLDVFEPMLQEGVVEAIVAPSGSCTTMTSHFYSAIFEEDGNEEDRRRADALAAVTFELSEFLVDVLGITRTGSQFDGKLTYHACCHLLRELHVDEQPRTLLNNVEGAEMVELAGDEECCGFGGLFSVKNSGISTAMGQRKCLNLAQSDADAVALCDVSCMTHINGVLSRQSQSVRAVHIAEILNNQIISDQAPVVHSDDAHSHEAHSHEPAGEAEPAAGDGAGQETGIQEGEETQRVETHPEDTPDQTPDRDSAAAKPRRWQDI